MIIGTVTAATIVLLVSSTAGAQEAAQKPKDATPPAVEQATEVRPQQRGGQPINIRLDLTIADELTTGQPSKRTVTMIVADRQSGSIRSTGNQVQARLFVDASPQLLSNGQILVILGLEYNPQQPVLDKEASQGPFAGVPQMPPSTGGSSLNQRITLVLHPDKPLVISQAPDPVSDRKISVEVRATILK